MRIPVFAFLAITTLVGSLVFVDNGVSRLAAVGTTATATGTDASVHQARVATAFGNLPLSFEANRGQTAAGVDFLARGHGYTLFLSAEEAVLSLHAGGAGPDPHDTATAHLRMNVVGGAPDAASGQEELPGKVNSFTGNDRAAWRTNIPTYAKVLYANVYPNIDLVYYGNQGRLEYDFVVRPGSDPSAISLRFDGPDGLQLDEHGNLLLRLGARTITQLRPFAYQDQDGTRVPVPAGYRVGSDGLVRFDLGAHDRATPLVIDPVLAYSTYLGGSNFDSASSIALDAFGNAVVAGETSSPDFPTTLGAFQSTLAAPRDAFVAKLSLLGNTLIYSTFLGGSGDDVGKSVALDGSGNAHVTGETKSTDFPTTLAAFQNALAGPKDAFVTTLNQQGNALLYSTYLGGTDEDGGLAVAVGPSGNTVVTGLTTSTDFPTTLGAYQTARAGRGEVFVTKLNPAGTGLVYSTYIGGTNDEAGQGIALDVSENAYVTGYTLSLNYPTTPGVVQPVLGGHFDAFVTKVNPLGTALVYSTFIGGTETDGGQGIVVDSSGAAYFAGGTLSTNFPTTPGAFQTVNAGSFDAFVAKLNPSGSAFIYSTYLGGSTDDLANGIAIDASGSAYLTGYTFNQGNFPTASAFQATNAGGFDAFVTKLNPQGAALEYSSFLGGSIADLGLGIAADTSGNAYVVGRTDSNDFPTTIAAFQPVGDSGETAFVAKVGLLGSTPLCSVNVNEGGWITAANGDMATFNGVVMTDAQNNVSGHETYIDHGPVQGMTVNSTTILATTCSDDRTKATIFGRATIDGSGDHVFRIDMVDGSQSGASDEYGISLDNGYMSGLQPLGGGNIVIH